MLQMDDYTPQAKMYWWITAATGLIVLAASILATTRPAPEALVPVLTGVLLAAVAVLFPVRIPGTKVSASAAEIFVFLLLLSFGPHVAVVAAAAEAAVISWRTSKRLTSRIGSPAMAALAMYACGNAFVWAAAKFPAMAGSGIGINLSLLVAAALIYFVIAVMLMTSLLKLKRGEPIRPLGMIGDHGSLGLAYACSAVIAALLYSGAGRFELPGVLIAVALTAALLGMLHFYHRQAGARARKRAAVQARCFPRS